MMPSPQDLADANLIEAVREHARWQEPCVLSEEGGVLRMAGANAFPGAFRNCVLRVDPKVPASVVLEQAHTFFQSHGRAYTLLARASRDGDLIEALQIQGMTALADSPCMLVEAPVAEAVVPAGIRIERMSELRHVQEVVRINAEAYEALRLPAAETHVFFGKPQALLSSRVMGFVAYRGEEPVSTALTLLSGQGAGVYWVGTAASAQRLGLAELCTRLATNAGFAAGARVVTLQASPLGEPIYRRMGYTVYDRQLRFRFPAAAV
jgi:ribosomal protein S18 acetylase RimI-like enzyme